MAVRSAAHGEGGGSGGGGGGDAGGGGGVNMQMHCWDEEHERVLPPSKTKRMEGKRKAQPGGLSEFVPDVIAVFSDKSSAVAAASHSLVVMMRPPSQEPLSVM